MSFRRTFLRLLFAVPAVAVFPVASAPFETLRPERMDVSRFFRMRSGDPSNRAGRYWARILMTERGGPGAGHAALYALADRRHADPWRAWALHRRGKPAVTHSPMGGAEEGTRAGSDRFAHLFEEPNFDRDFGRIVWSKDAFGAPPRALQSVFGTRRGESRASAPFAAFLGPSGIANSSKALTLPLDESCTGPVEAAKRPGDYDLEIDNVRFE